MGTAQKFHSEADPLPLTLFAGAGFKVKQRFLASVEADFPRDNKVLVGSASTASLSPTSSAPPPRWASTAKTPIQAGSAA